jgi:glycosyltransferase involved in cell wall biosynthesis
MASFIVCDSWSTQRDVDRLVPAVDGQHRRTILLSLNHSYCRISADEARIRLGAIPKVPWTSPFLLHVGSNEARKNKVGALRAFAKAAGRWPGNFVLCGADLTKELRAAAVAAGVSGRVFAVPRIDNAQLEAAYNLAHALLFPSKCEGFGWPIIEAQACGCPVICSDRTSLPEVGGPAALVHALEDEDGMAESVLRLTEMTFRAEVVARGFANLRRFTVDRMMDEYGEVYEDALANVGRIRQETEPVP